MWESPNFANFPCFFPVNREIPYTLLVMLAALMFQFNSARRVLLTIMTIPLIATGAALGLIAFIERERAEEVPGAVRMFAIHLDDRVHHHVL